MEKEPRDFPLVKQLLYKLSSVTIWDKLRNGLDKVKHKYREGVKNLYIINTLGSDHIQINSITVASETKRKQEFGMADIEELDQEEEENDLIMDDNEEANVNSIMVNRIPIGKACSPYEVI